MPRPKPLSPLLFVAVAGAVLLGIAILFVAVSAGSEADDHGRWERASKDMAALFEAANKYQQTTGEYPAKLDDLPAQLGNFPPRNPFSNEPYGYRRTLSGFVLTFRGKDEAMDVGEKQIPFKDIVYIESGLVPPLGSEKP